MLTTDQVREWRDEATEAIERIDSARGLPPSRLHINTLLRAREARILTVCDAMLDLIESGEQEVGRLRGLLDEAKGYIAALEHQMGEEEAIAFVAAAASPLDPPPGFNYLGRATQAGPNDEDVYGYEWADTGRRIYLDRTGRAYTFLGVSVSGDNVFTWAEDADDPKEANFWKSASETGMGVE